MDSYFVPHVTHEQFLSIPFSFDSGIGKNEEKKIIFKIKHMFEKKNEKEKKEKIYSLYNINYAAPFYPLFHSNITHFNLSHSSIPSLSL